MTKTLNQIIFFSSTKIRIFYFILHKCLVESCSVRLYITCIFQVNLYIPRAVTTIEAEPRLIFWEKKNREGERKKKD